MSEPDEVEAALAKIAALRNQGWEIVREEGPLTTEMIRDFEHDTYRVVVEQQVRFRLRRIDEHDGPPTDMVGP